MNSLALWWFVFTEPKNVNKFSDTLQQSDLWDMQQEWLQFGFWFIAIEIKFNELHTMKCCWENYYYLNWNLFAKLNTY